MVDPREPLSGWISYEVCWWAGEELVTPFTEALSVSGKLAKQAVTKMRMVQHHGWPEARDQLKDNKGRKLIVPKDDVIWLLKCKPSCWRLYFYVFQKEEVKRLIYLYAVCKRRDEENRNDAIFARRVADSIRPGGSSITEFDFPAG